jgi:hypothetical protein
LTNFDKCHSPTEGAATYSGTTSPTPFHFKLLHLPSSYHSKFFLMKTILPASSGSIRFLNVFKRRDTVLKIRSLGASVAGMHRYFCARHERIGKCDFFYLHQMSGSANFLELSWKGGALNALYLLISCSISLAMFATASSSPTSSATSSSL